MAKIIHLKDLKVLDDYEPPFGLRVGISSETVDNPKITMSYVINPPGSRNQRHYHVNADAVVYVIKGHTRLWVGPDDKIEEFETKTGDFVYIPRGEIHGNMNVSDTEPVEVISVKIGVSSFEEEETIFVEPRKK